MKRRPAISLVAAMGRNRVIGLHGAMPWHLPADLKHFKQITMGKPMIMGRKTHEAIGRALPGRKNIVVSRTLRNSPRDIIVAASIDEALALVEDEQEVMVIGGGQLYATLLPVAGCMYITIVDCEPEGDTWFPEWRPDEWREVERTIRCADQDNAFQLTFLRLRRTHGV